jgi:REP element-mobilizing transposase RayT
MIHGYHAIFGTYGSWLPNDPRSSKSKFVGGKKLFRIAGKATKKEPRSFEQLLASEERSLEQLRSNLSRREVVLTDRQIELAADAIDEVRISDRLTIWALAVLPCHVHIVLARSGGRCEKIVDGIKNHIYQVFDRRGDLPAGCNAENSIWAGGRWIEFLDSETSIENAIAYVMENPAEAGRPKQTWPFIVPFSGIEKNIVSYSD